MNKEYDIVVAYRIYPGISKQPAIFSDNKPEMSELCLKSFKQSLGSLKVKMFVLLDNCPIEYKNLFQKYFLDEDLEFIELSGIGNAKSFVKQIEILLKQNHSEYIYFAEDDYFYLPDSFIEMIDLIKLNQNVDFVTPYNHIDYYTLPLHNYKSNIILGKKKHFASASSTCLTFLTTKHKLSLSKKVFETYLKNNSDAGIWISLTKTKVFNLKFMIRLLQNDVNLFKNYVKAYLFCWKQILFGRRFELYYPLETIATHIEITGLAPIVNWEKAFKDCQEAKL